MKTIDEILEDERERCHREADERALRRGPDPYEFAFRKSKPKRRRPADFYPPYLRRVK